MFKIGLVSAILLSFLYYLREYSMNRDVYKFIVDFALISEVFVYENIYHNWSEGFKMIINPLTRTFVSLMLLSCLIYLRDSANFSEFVSNFALISMSIIGIIEFIIILTWVFRFISSFLSFL